MADKKDGALFVRFIERFKENSLDVIPNKANRDAFLDNLNAAAQGFSGLLDKNGEIAPEKIKNLTTAEKKSLRDRLDYNKDGYITDQELATIRDYTRIAPGMPSANSDITKIRETLQSAGIDLGTAPQKSLTDSFGTKIEGGFAPKKLTVREVFLASTLQAMDTGNDDKLVKVGKNFEIKHVEGNPNKKLDDTELTAIPNHVLRGIFDTNADGVTKRNEYLESNVKYLTGIDVPVSALMDAIGEGPAKPNPTPKNDIPTKGGRIK